jgi:hypothetical protein
METSVSSGRKKRLFHRKSIATINAIEYVLLDANSYLAYRVDFWIGAGHWGTLRVVILTVSYRNSFRFLCRWGMFCALGVRSWKLSNVGRLPDEWPKIYYLEFLVSEGTLSRWSWLHLQSFVPTPVSRRVDVSQAAARKNSCLIFDTTWWKHVIPTPLSGIRVGK